MPSQPQAETAAMSLPINQGIDISKVMKSEGPIVDAVLLSATDSAVKAIRLDTTPKNQMVAKTLGGPFTFLGQYEDEGLMLMIRRDPDDSLPTNPHKMQPPFNETTVKGDILVLKVAPETPEEEANAQEVFKPNDEFFLNYTKEEYEAFAARTDVVPVAVSPTNSDEVMSEEEVASEEEEEEEVEGEDDSEDEDEAGGFMAMLMGNVLQRFQEENGRKPSEEELKALESAISQKLGGMEA
ncbi:MAG: hypothetical protein SGBAC_003637 [Bacillariaceae sp.]